MSKRTYVGATMVGLAVVLTATALVASNMGFKLNYSMVQAGAAVDVGTSKTGTGTIALPDNRQTGMNSAKNLLDDIGLASVTDVRRWVRSADSFAQIYTGRVPQTAANDYALTSAEGYAVKMKTTTNYIIVGSDNPALASNFVQAGVAVDVGTSKTGQNLFAYNYHQTAGTAKGLLDDIGLASVTDVRRWVRSADSFAQIYTGRVPQTAANDYTLTPGEAYIVRMKTTTLYTPSHY